MAKRFLYSAGLLLMLLGLDDAFLLHEQFFPFIGIPEKAVYVIYACLVLSFLYGFKEHILRTAYPLLAAGLSLFAASVLMDVIQPGDIDIFLVEDGAKLVGIMSWAAYFSHAAYSYSTHALFVQEPRIVESSVVGRARSTVPEPAHAHYASPDSYRKRASLLS